MSDQPLVIESDSSYPHLRVLRLIGPLTLTNMFEFQALVRQDDLRGLLVDMTQVPYVDSAGLGCLMSAHVSHARTGRKFLLAGVNERVEALFQATKVADIFARHATPEQALAAAAN